MSPLWTISLAPFVGSKPGHIYLTDPTERTDMFLSLHDLRVYWDIPLTVKSVDFEFYRLAPPEQGTFTRLILTSYTTAGRFQMDQRRPETTTGPSFGLYFPIMGFPRADLIAKFKSRKIKQVYLKIRYED